MSSRSAAVEPKAGGHPRLRVTARAAVVLTIVTLLGMALAVPVRLYLDQREHLEQMQADVAALQDRNTELTGELERLADPAYLEQLARACLGMVRRGETAFVVVPKNGAPEPVACTPTG